MGFLAYKQPGEEKITLERGIWYQVDFKDLPEECFFISSFTKGETYYFKKLEEISSVEEKNLHFSSPEDIFVVNQRFYLAGLDHFIDGFESLNIEKAIYSRIKSVEREEQTVFQIFQNLVQAYAEEAFVYLVSDEQFGTWVGATPEILIKGKEEKLQTMALAGTKSEEKREWTDKEEEEHQYVVDFIKERVEKLKASSLVMDETRTVKNGKVYHLRTDFQFQLPSSEWSQLIEELHPTPAVCGTPQDLAEKYILTYEPHDRKFYTGIIGFKNTKEIAVYVNLRCMQVLKDSYAIYVGGGITKASVINQEWQETEAKSQTLLSVIKK